MCNIVSSFYYKIHCCNGNCLHSIYHRSNSGCFEDQSHACTNFISFFSQVTHIFFKENSHNLRQPIELFSPRWPFANHLPKPKCFKSCMPTNIPMFTTSILKIFYDWKIQYMLHTTQLKTPHTKTITPYLPTSIMIKRSIDFGDSFPNPNFLNSFAQMHTNKRSNAI